MRDSALSLKHAAKYPGLFQEVGQKVGREATAKLVDEYGGTRLYIPYKLNSEHALYQLLGQEVSQQLSGEFGGVTVEIPLDVGSQKKRRNKLILADRAAGMSERQAARKYQLTSRTIRKITNS
jgi:Mor family transcriptional regulator